MPRPHRPNTRPNSPRGEERAVSHIQQELAYERKQRLCAEALERQEEYENLSGLEKTRRNIERR